MTDRQSPRDRWLFILAIAVSFGLVLVACSSFSENTQDEVSEAESGDDDGSAIVAGGDTAADPRAGGPVVNDAGFSVAGVAYQNVDYNVEPAGSALVGERDGPQFPPPLIPTSDIVAVLPPDAIPAIDNPQYLPLNEIDFVQPSEAVIAVDINGDVRAYPVQIMVFHEIVNDEIGGIPVTVTYCPLCNSALAFDRRVGERVLDFGTSGSLFQSALVMYDRQTESLWTHFTGEGVVGHYAGVRLEPVSIQTLSFQQLALQHPGAMVLTRDTGASREYGVNPYISYDEETSDPRGEFFRGDVDPRLEPKARVVGFLIDDQAHAVDIELGEEPSVHEVAVSNGDVVIFQHPGLASALDRAAVASGRDVGQTGVFIPEASDGQTLSFSVEGESIVDDQTGSTWTLTGEAIDGPLAGETLNPVGHLNTFWFAWSTYHPDTVIVNG